MTAPGTQHRVTAVVVVTVVVVVVGATSARAMFGVDNGRGKRVKPERIRSLRHRRVSRSHFFD